MTTRAQYRSAVGGDIGRRYYVSSFTTGTSTADEIVDSKRTEYAQEWDGATIKIGGEEVQVRGTSTGRIFLDSPLVNGAPAQGTAYEMVKGFTIQDMNDAIDFALRASYPAIYDPINDQGVSVQEVVGQELYPLPATWQLITRVLREVQGTTAPVLYDPYLEGYDFEVFLTTAGLTYRSRRVTGAGVKLWFFGEATAVLGASDGATSLAPIDIVKFGALYYLYQKGTNPDELSLNAAFDKEETEAEADWNKAMVRLSMNRETSRKVKTPRVGVVNTGNTQWFG